jgi:phosphatidylserine/phosphatidylglycerophosphate/cardiolipin synthase-like enzyme
VIDMDKQRQAVARQAQRLAAELPPAMTTMLADAIEQSDGPDVAAILATVPQPHYRALTSEFLTAWRLSFPGLGSQAVATALSTAAVAEQARREERSVELVWTGPEADAVPLRHTEQALLQVIDAARERLLVVSYAVYKIPRIGEALARAASRGVTLRIVIEGAHRQDGLYVHDRLRALGDAIATRACVYLWPLDLRPRNEEGNHGVLHVKCAVADGRWLFLSSANLTANAFTLNMELGVLVRDETVAGEVEQHFDRLVTTRTLVGI